MARGSSPLTRGKHALSIRVRRALGLIPAHAGKTWAYPSATFPPRAHPRSRGENGPAAGMVPRVVGSSPLTRGKQTNAALAGPPGRLIPAHAGKTWSYVTGPDNLWAHPRSRGENAFRRRKRQHTRGSSPLTRGKRPRAQPLHASQRLIPAHAGKTPRRHRVAASLPAHPRSRGENGRCSLSFSLLRGSSPLTRGKRGLVVACEVGARLIPAHAGKTLWWLRNSRMVWAHPRSRGENSASALAFSRPHGSSPLTRGKRSVTVPVNITARLIPAHAGKTYCQDCRALILPAHPRSRGENLVSAVQVGNAGGSSPLTRGKRAGHGRGPGPEGLIPAHAGKTTARRRTTASVPAHPRSRGENEMLVSMSLSFRGSSPLTRGKLGHGLVEIRGRRLIPAHAGKTSFLASSCVSLEAHPRSRGENDLEWRILLCTTGSSPLTRGKRRIAAGEEFTDRLIPAHAGKTGMAGTRRWRTTAHPRSRGENIKAAVSVVVEWGSSPLTRGKQRAQLGRHFRPGLIPAHAGKTRCSSAS